MIHAGRLVAPLILAVAAGGCATSETIDVEPFETYRRAAVELAASVEVALAFEREWAYDDYVAALAAGEERPADVILQFPADGIFLWSLPDAPVIDELRSTEARLSQLNELFERYTALLVTLAGGDAEDAARIEAMAERLNANARSAADAAGVALDAEHGALFATAAAAAAEAWLANRRLEDLAAVLAANQDAVQAFAGLGAEVAQLSATGIKDSYQDQTDRWIDRFVGASPVERAALVEDQLAVNERTIGQLRGLGEIHDGYLALADAHAQLADGLVEGAMPGLQALVEQASGIRALYRRLAEEGGAGTQ